MRELVLCGLLLAAVAGPLGAQAGHDTAAGSREARARVEQRFAERLKQELDLTDEQAARLKVIATEHGDRRRELRRREKQLRSALDGQIRGGEATDQDSVARLTRELLDLRVEYAEIWREELKQLDFLTPVQRARLLVMRERLLQRVHEMRNDRRGFRHRGDAH